MTTFRRMRPLVRCFALLLSCAAGCGLGLERDASGARPPEPVPSDEAQAWLDTHNAVRRSPQPPPPAPLPTLTWSAAAAQVAQAWADGCNYQHNAGRGSRGENIAATAPPNVRDLAFIVGKWAEEVQDYDYASNTCARGKECGHYTQIVWRDTLRVGCARRTCQANSPFGPSAPSWDFWVCDYEPAGNFVGQRPY
jgi:pathogenesis-related protein 1